MFLSLLLVTGWLPQEPAETTDRPNIIFILADDLGYGDLGCFGQTVIRTPRLDEMAAQGMRLTDFYAGSTVCAPSRCTLMTGLHTGHARVRGNARVPLEPVDVTVAEVLKEAGYTTGIVGKWGLGEPGTTGIPNRQGFDYWFGYLNQRHAHNFYPEYLWRNEEKVVLEGNKAKGGVSSQRAQYSHDLFTSEALEFIKRQQKAQPFFLYLAYTIPHTNNERGRAEGDGMEVPDYGIYADRDWPQPQKGHAAMITRMDHDIGKVIDLLRELQMDRNTLVIFSSDNGTHREGGARPEFFKSSGRLRGIKRALYEGGIRVPTLAWWPGTIQAGSTSDSALAFWDFLPTAAELAGLEPPAGLDGISFVNALLGKEQEKHDYLYWEFYEGTFAQALRIDGQKFIKKHGKPLEWYDLRKDLEEKAQRNVDFAPKFKSMNVEEFMNHVRTPSKHWKTPAEKAASKK